MDKWQVDDAYRLKKIFSERSELSQEAFGDKFKIGSQGMIWQYLNARTPLNLAAAIKFAKGLRVKVSDFSPNLAEELAQPPGSGRTQHEPNGERTDDLYLWDSNTPLGEDDVDLPLLEEVELSAGNGVCEAQVNYNQKMRFSKSSLRRCNVDINNAVCVKVTGSSMSPVLPDGSTVGIDTSKISITDGKMYAIDHGGMLRVKYLYRIPGGGVRIKSFNSEEYEDESYSKEQAVEIKIIGRVFWHSVFY